MKRLLSCFIICFLSSCAMYIKPLSSVQTRQDNQTIDHWFERLHANGQFNGQVLISQHGQTIYQNNFGFRDTTNTQPITNETAFNLASASKQFTAFGILLLAHQGKLDLDAPADTYLSGLSLANSPTVRELLHHQGGLKEYFSVAEKKPTLENPMTNAIVLENLSRHHQQRPPKHTNYQYSNSGYIVLAEIISHVSGESFEDFMLKQVFQPAGLTNTRVYNLLSKTELTNRAIGYKINLIGNKQLKDLNEWDGVAGDGGVYSTAEDLLRWHQSLMQGKLLPVSYYQQAMQINADKPTAKKAYGMGWFILADQEVEHAGGWQGFASYYYRNEKTNNTIILLDNASHSISLAPIGTRWNSIALNTRRWLKSKQ